MTGLEYKIREVLLSEQVEEEIVDKDIDEADVCTDSWRVIQQPCLLTVLMVAEGGNLKSYIILIKQNALIYPDI